MFTPLLFPLALTFCFSAGGTESSATQEFLRTRSVTPALGHTLYQKSDFYSNYLVRIAINPDGGASTTRVVKGQIVNSPSDRTGERPVANTLHVISKTITKTK